MEKTKIGLYCFGKVWLCRFLLYMAVGGALAALAYSLNTVNRQENLIYNNEDTPNIDTEIPYEKASKHIYKDMTGRHLHNSDGDLGNIYDKYMYRSNAFAKKSLLAKQKYNRNNIQSVPLPVNNEAFEKSLVMIESRKTVQVVSKGKVATQSSNGDGDNGKASKALDGNTHANHNRYKSCAVTQRQKYPWWRVNLVTMIPVTKVVIINRADCCSSELRNFYVFVTDEARNPTLYSPVDACGHKLYTETFGGGETITIPCDGLYGRFVTIFIKDETPHSLSLCEVEVYGIATEPCDEGQHDCDTNRSSCLPTKDAQLYSCQCKPGFIQHTSRECYDIDECKEGTHDCGENATCSNTNGSFECTCNKGYRGNGRTCTDVDECREKLHDCDVNAACTNYPSTFKCLCKKGYSGNDKTCEERNECEENTHNCGHNALCANTGASYVCLCKPGYDGDGITCTDINECALGNICPDPHSTCKNVPTGSYTCECNEGYVLQGETNSMTCVAKVKTDTFFNSTLGRGLEGLSRAFGGIPISVIVIIIVICVLVITAAILYCLFMKKPKENTLNDFSYEEYAADDSM